MVPLGMANADLEETVRSTGLSGSFLASRVALEDNDDRAAIQFLKRAVLLDPENARLKQDYFAALVSGGEIDEAVELLRDNQVNMGARTNLAGMTLATDELRRRSYRLVPDTLKDVAGGELDKTLREIVQGWALAGEGKIDEAIARIDDLSGPEWMAVMKDHHAGLILAMEGRNESARERFKAVVDNRAVITVLTETYIRSLQALIRLQSSLGKTDEARENLNYGLSLLAAHPPFLAMAKQLDEGAVLTPMLATPQEGVAELYYNIATAVRRDGGGNFSKSYLQLARALAPESDLLTMALAELYLQQGFYERSNELYSAIPTDSILHRMAELEKGNNLARLERNDEAIEVLKTLVQEDPSDLTGYTTLGGIYAREERYRDAADLYDRAVETISAPKTQHWNLFFRRGIAYERLKEWEKAEPNFKKSLELSPDQPEVLNYLGYSWIDQGINLDEGMAMIRRAVELRPRSGFIVDSLGWAHYRLGQFKDAVRELERAVSLMPNDPTINDHLGDAYWRVDRKLEAMFQWKIALASKEKPEKPELIERKLKEGLDPVERDQAKVQFSNDDVGSGGETKAE